MKIKIIHAKPVPTPPDTFEVTFNEAEARFIHKVLGKFSFPSLIEHLELDDENIFLDAERTSATKMLDTIFDTLKPVIGLDGDGPVKPVKK